MDRRGNIYELTDDQISQLNGNDTEEKTEAVELAEDVARLDGYLRGRAHADRLRGPGANRDLSG